MNNAYGLMIEKFLWAYDWWIASTKVEFRT